MSPGLIHFDHLKFRAEKAAKPRARPKFQPSSSTGYSFLPNDIVLSSIPYKLENENYSESFKISIDHATSFGVSQYYQAPTKGHIRLLCRN